MKTILLSISLLCLLSACVRSQSSNNPIVLVAFGTSYAQGQADLEAIDTAVCKAYPNREIHWAFTSDRILEKLLKNGDTTVFARKVPLANLSEVLNTLDKAGHKSVTIQSLHIVPGEEWTQMRTTALPKGMQAEWGAPLLTDQASIDAALSVLAPRLATSDTATVLVAHGNSKHTQFNKELLMLGQTVRARFPRTLVASVEGSLSFDKALPEITAWKCSKVRFVPFMLVAGDHALNDVMGDEADSWKNQVKLPATCDKGLGSDPGIAEIFVKRIASAKE
jgi:sirohydrochlorin cobaltochelatase